MATAAFKEDEVDTISEETAERIALGLEAFLIALVVVILALFFWTVTL